MGFMLSYAICFFGAAIMQHRYSRKKIKTNIGWIATRSYIFLATLFVMEFLLCAGVFDSALQFLNPNLPTANTGLYYYFNCILFGWVNLGIPVQPNTGYYTLAILLCASYIPIFRDGQGYGRVLFGKRWTQWGLWPIVAPLKKPKNWKELEAKWATDAAKRQADQEYCAKVIEEGLKRADALGLKNKIKGFYK